MSGGRSNLFTLALPHPAESRPPASEETLTLRGNLNVISILDLLQWLCSNRQTWKVRLYGQGVDGDVVVFQGQLVDARWGLTRGLVALTEIVGCQFGCFELVSIDSGIEGTLQGNSQALLLNAVRELDERNHQILQRANSTIPPSYRPPAENAAMSGEHALPAATLIDLGFLALRNANAEEAKRLWTRALSLDPDNRSLQFNLRKLERHDTPIL